MTTHTDHGGDSSIWDGTAKEVPEVSSKIVRVFLSSTFSDMGLERNELLSKVVPKLQQYCKEKYGVEFQLVDMRWGVTHEAQVDHMTSAVCRQEIRNCQQMSVGPNFVALVGQKYGYRPFPPLIESDEFEILRDFLHQSGEDISLLNTWYKKDENSIPVQYVLLPITAGIADYDSTNEDKRKTAESKWSTIFASLKKQLQKAATIAFEADRLNRETADKYCISVTEDEISQGILDYGGDINKKCLCFVRTFSDMHNYLQHARASRYIDLLGNSEEIDTEAQDLLKTLRDRKIPDALDKQNLVKFTVNWSKNGIGGVDPEVHKDYLEKFCQTFYDKLSWLIDENLNKAENLKADEQLTEIIQHLNVRKEWSEVFFGRDDVLSQVKEHVLEKGEFPPLVLYGESGSGKTAAIAKSACLTDSWLGQVNSVTVVRFLGTTPQSSNIHLTLKSICHQISQAYNKDVSDIPSDFSLLVDLFKSLLKLSTKERPLVVYLDSLDQLSTIRDDHRLHWLPEVLPRHSKLILSVVPSVYNLLERIQVQVPDTSQYVEILPLGDALSMDVLDARLQTVNRKISPEQENAVSSLFHQCSLPLFSKIIFEEICHWKSYTEVTSADISTSVSEAIHQLFERLEVQHGKVLVAHALSYITASRNGLSEVELLDILSLDDDVLNSMFLFWLPPVRRLPTFLWTSLHIGLSKYLVQREANGSEVMYWYHRQFRDVARDRYLKDPLFLKKIHSNLADYFLGTWGGGKRKPFHFTPFLMARLGRKSSLSEEDRRVPLQPLEFRATATTTNFNRRMLSELPVHLLESGRIEELNSNVIFCYKWLHTKLRAMGLQTTLVDLTVITNALPTEGIRLLLDALRIAGNLLNFNPDNLSLEISGRLLEFYDINSDIRSLIQQCDQDLTAACNIVPPFQLFDSPPRALMNSLEAHSSEVADIVLVNNGAELLSLSRDGYLAIWDMEKGELIKKVHLPNFQSLSNLSLQLFVDRACKYALCRTKFPDNKLVVVSLDSHTVAYKYNMKSNSMQHRIRTGSSYMCVDNAVFVTATGKLVHHLRHYAKLPGYVCLAITMDDKNIMIGLQNSLEMFDIETCKRFMSFEMENIASSISLSLDGRLAVVGQSVDCKIRLFDIAKTAKTFGHEVAEFDPENVFKVTSKSGRFLTEEVNELFLSPSGRIFASLTRRLYIIVWSLENISYDPVLMSSPNTALEVKYFFGVTISADDRYVLAAELSSFMYMWEAETGQLLTTFPAHQNDMHKIVASPCSNVAITCAHGDIALRVWDIDLLPKTSQTTEDQKLPVKNVSLATKGSLAFVTHVYPLKTSKAFHYIDYFGIECWDLFSGLKTTLLPFGQYGQVYTVEISEDGEMLALVIGTISHRWVHLIDLKTSTLLQSLETSECVAVRISPNKSCLAVMVQGSTPTANVYDVDTLDEICRLDDCVDVIFADASTIFGIRRNRKITIAEIPSGEVTTQDLFLPGDIVNVKYIPVTDSLIICCSTGTPMITSVIYKARGLGMLGEITGIDKTGLCGLSADGSRGIDGSLQVFDLNRCRKLRQLQDGKYSNLEVVRLSRNGDYAIWIDKRPTDCVKICNIEKGTVSICCLHAIPECIDILDSGDVMVVTSKDKHTYVLAICNGQLQEADKNTSKDDRLRSIVGQIGGGSHKDDIRVTTLSARVQEALKLEAERNRVRNMNFDTTAPPERRTSLFVPPPQPRASTTCVVL